MSTQDAHFTVRNQHDSRTAEESRGGCEKLAVRVLQQTTEVGWERSADLCKESSKKQGRFITEKDA